MLLDFKFINMTSVLKKFVFDNKIFALSNSVKELSNDSSKFSIF